ncbi:MAG TPA: radical SAM protein [Polyangiaceae bacterium]|nr:radical SAM protein [Polyangiaceae bacterium]
MTAAPVPAGVPRPKVLLVGLYDVNTVALAPEILKSYVEAFPVGRAFDVRTLNLSIFSQSVDEMEARVRAQGAAIIGFSAYIWNVTLVRELSRRLPGTIIVGGPQTNGATREFFAENPGVDYVVVGEGEETFKELLEYFAGERTLDTVRGVVTEELVTAPRPVVADLAQVPSPYPRIFAENPGLEWIAYETSRGCPYLCGFCTWGYSKKMRYHSLERVFADLDVILSQPRLERIYLCDSSILLDKPRAKAILGHILERNRDVVIRYEFNAEHLDDEIIELLLKLSENEFNFGVQTTNPMALRAMRRPFHQTKFETNYAKMVRRTERTAITMDVIYGLPGDDLAGFKASLDYVMSFEHVRWILTNPLILLPGSDFHADRERHGIVVRDAESFIVESTATFSKADMAEAIRLSFLVSVVFFNERLRDVMKTFARDHGRGYVEAIADFFDALPFRLVDGQYPYLVPSIARDFRERNLAIYAVQRLYPDIVRFFDVHTGGAYRAELAGWEEAFVPQYHRLVRFAAEEARRAGIVSSPVRPLPARNSAPAAMPASR